MKKLILFIVIFLSLSTYAMEDKNTEVIIEKQNFQKKRRQNPTQITPTNAICKTTVLSLKTLMALKIGKNLVDLAALQKKNLPEGLITFIITCSEISRQTRLNNKHLVISLLLADPNNQPSLEIISITPKQLKKIFNSALKTASPHLAKLILLEFQKQILESDEKTNDNYSSIQNLQVIILIVESIRLENLIDSGIDNQENLSDYTSALSSLKSFIELHTINLNEIEKTNCFEFNVRPMVLLARLMGRMSTESRNFKTLTVLLDMGLKVNQFDEKNQSALAVNSSLDFVNFLLSKKAKPRKRLSSRGEGALAYAIARRDLETANLLFEFESKHETTQIECILILIINGQLYQPDDLDYDLEAVSFLLSKNVNVYTKYETDESPLIYALKCHNEKADRRNLCNLIISHAQRVKPVYAFICLVNDILASGQSINTDELILNIFENTNSINDKDELGNTPLIALCYHGLFALASKIIEKIDDINTENKKGETALWFVIDYICTEQSPSVIDQVQLEFVQLLLNKGANPLQVAKNGKTPLSIAMQHNHSKLINLLGKY